MSNSAVIKIDKTPLCIFTRWYGTFDDIVAYAYYAKLKNFGTPDVDPSGITSLIQVMANAGDGGFGVEVMPYESAQGIETDNGTFVLEAWDVVDIKGNRGSEHEVSEDLVARIIRIDACQPEPFRLGDEFIRDISSRKATFSGELAVGDVIWDRGEGSIPVRATIVGFGDSGYPYVHVDMDPSSPTGKPQVPDHYAREHFGKFLGNSTWFARIPELSHPQVKAAAFRGRPADQNLPGQINLQAPAVEQAEEHYESPVIFPELEDAERPALDDVAAGQPASPMPALEADMGSDEFGFDDIDEPTDVEVPLDEGFGDAPATDLESEATDMAPVAEPAFGDDFSDLDEAFDDSDLSDTGLIQMVIQRGAEEDESSITNELVIPMDATSSTDDVRIPEALAEIAGEEHMVMTNANENTSNLTIVQPLPQDEEAIDAVTMQVPADTGRSVFIPREPREIEPDLSTDAVAKNPKPYPDVLDADFEPYESE